MSELKVYTYDDMLDGVADVDVEYYLKSKVDKILAKKDKEIESLKASHYADSVDAGMRERRLRRALYKACSNWAHHRVFVRLNTNEKVWINMERKCRAKAEQYR